MSKNLYYLVRGAKLSCDRGSAPRKLNLPLCHGVYILNQPMMNANDYKANVNVMHFGTCSETGGKCEPQIFAPWFKAHEKVLVDGVPAITTDSFLVCGKGGLIEPETSGQELVNVLMNSLVAPPKEINRSNRAIDADKNGTVDTQPKEQHASAFQDFKTGVGMFGKAITGKDEGFNRAVGEFGSVFQGNNENFNRGVNEFVASISKAAKRGIDAGKNVMVNTQPTEQHTSAFQNFKTGVGMFGNAVTGKDENFNRAVGEFGSVFQGDNDNFNKGVNEFVDYVKSARTPDYKVGAVSTDFAKICGLDPGVMITYDWYGNIYYSVTTSAGASVSPVSGSIFAGWVNSDKRPEEGDLIEFLTGESSGVAAGYGIGGGVVRSASGMTSTEVGLTVPNGAIITYHTTYWKKLERKDIDPFAGYDWNGCIFER